MLMCVRVNMEAVKFMLNRKSPLLNDNETYQMKVVFKHSIDGQ